MTYPIGTQLIFTSLTQASAAADLFGVHSLDTLYVEPSEISDDKIIWRSGFWVDGRYWRIVIDTPEKQGWFVPQDGDILKVSFASVAGMPAGCSGLTQPDLIVFQGRWNDAYFDEHGLELNELVIIQRNNKPFPQPCEVI